MTEIQHHKDSGLSRTKEPGYPAVPCNGVALGGAGARSRLDSRAFSFSAVASDSVPTNQETGPMCANSPYITVHHNNRTITIQPDCETWGCDYCRQLLKDKWLNHIAETVEQDGRKQRGVMYCDVFSFPAVSRRIRRHDQDYFRVRYAWGEYFLLVVGDELPPGATDCTSEEAIGRFAELVEQVKDSKDGNPLSSSRKFARPRKETSVYELVAIGPTPAQVRLVAALAAAKCVERTINTLTATVCTGSESVIMQLCGMIAALCPNSSKAQTVSRGEILDMVDGDTDKWGCWRGQPDEEMSPYLVGAVT